MSYPRRSERGVPSPGAELMDTGEPTDMGVSNGIQVFYKSSRYCQLLSHLSSPLLCLTGH